jgi:hypothetical protein
MKSVRVKVRKGYKVLQAVKMVLILTGRFRD